MQTYLNQIVDFLLTQSWQIAVLTIAVAVAAFALKNRSAHVRYLLWLIVLAKCLMPSLYTIPLGVLPREILAARRSAVPRPGTLPTDSEVMDSTVAASRPMAPEMPGSPALEARLAEAPKVRAVRPTAPAKSDILQWIGIAWIVGALGYLGMNLLRALRADCWLWRRRRPLSSKLQAELQNMFSAYGFRRLPGIWLMDDVSQPFVWGLLRGNIYLPVDFVGLNDPKRKKSILAHELSHTVRFDAAVNILQVIAQAIFWFHPFVWWANKRIRQEREKCCDEMVIARLDAIPRDYSTAILDTLATKYKSTRPVPSLAVAGPAKNIEERIEAMLRPGKNSTNAQAL